MCLDIILQSSIRVLDEHCFDDESFVVTCLVKIMVFVTSLPACTERQRFFLTSSSEQDRVDRNPDFFPSVPLPLDL